MTHQRHLVSPAGIARAIAADLSRPAATDGIDVIKSERGTLVWKQACPDVGCNGVFKLYRHINPIKLFRSRISKGRRSKREFAALSRLRRAGVPCSEPLDVFCGRTPEAGLCEVLVTKCIEGGIPLETLAGEGRGFAQLDLAPLYRIVRRAHESGTYHGALSPRNILVTGDAGAEAGPKAVQGPPPPRPTPYISAHCTTLHYIALHYATLSFSTLHCTAPQDTAVHYIFAMLLAAAEVLLAAVAVVVAAAMVVAVVVV